ncbi:MAG: EpsG family protein [Bacteroidaceae bacterium]|nr:EpsG family protein [Bacteroidaceae bacterium]
MPILFILSPFIAILLYTICAYNVKTINNKHLWSIAFMLAVYLGLLNSTKELLGDFEAYHYHFELVEKYKFIPYLMHFGKEPLYYTYTYIGYYLFLGNWPAFVVSLAVINYMLISYSIIRIGNYLKTDPKNIITALFIMAFFFQEFAATSNLVRQALSEAITMVFLTHLYLDNKKSWWIAVCAVLVHSSCIPILGLGIIPSIKKSFTIKGLIKLVAPLGILVVLFYAVASYLTRLPLIGYVFARALNISLGADKWQENVGLQPLMIALLFLFSCMCIYLYLKRDKKDDEGYIGFININIILYLLLIICNIIGAYFILSRYFFFVYALQNFIIIMFLHKFKLTNNDFARYSLLVVMIFYFFYNYTHNIFTYSSIQEAILYLLPEYLL